MSIRDPHWNCKQKGRYESNQPVVHPTAHLSTPLLSIIHLAVFLGPGASTRGCLNDYREGDAIRVNVLNCLIKTLRGLARIFHESPAATADMAVLPSVLGCRTLRRTVQVRLRSNTLRLPGGTPIFTVSPRQFMKHPGRSEVWFWADSIG